ncbi:hypothetical protein [Streptomyces sp. NPDC090445]|uniref:hypothetical protein n=1 Tax=Streptomyces sp. NPDC090445 TaxID=3365963 RepID=UPI00381923F7
MTAKTFRIAPLAALATAGLLVAGPVGAATAAPQQQTTTVTAEQHRPAAKFGPYASKQACQKAGKSGQAQGKWKHYACKQMNHKWWLYTS